jgi:SAM-dependent methyltransferase
MGENMGDGGNCAPKTEDISSFGRNRPQDKAHILDYDKLDTSTYNAARALPPETLIRWSEVIGRAAPPRRVERIVDAGCGTGRFIRLLAGLYPGARIVGLDPSRKMLAQAIEHANDRISVAAARAEAIPIVSRSADLILLSMVYHHLDNPFRCAAEFARLLTHAGVALIRTATRETNAQIDMFDLFPESRVIEDRRIPRRADIMDTFAAAGFRSAKLDTIEQLFAGTPAEYYNKISLRGLSSLQALPDDVFANRLADFKAHCDRLPSDTPIYEPVDLFEFRLEG